MHILIALGWALLSASCAALAVDEAKNGKRRRSERKQEMEILAERNLLDRRRLRDVSADREPDPAREH